MRTKQDRTRKDSKISTPFFPFIKFYSHTFRFISLYIQIYNYYRFNRDPSIEISCMHGSGPSHSFSLPTIPSIPSAPRPRLFRSQASSLNTNKQLAGCDLTVAHPVSVAICGDILSHLISCHSNGTDTLAKNVVCFCINARWWVIGGRAEKYINKYIYFTKCGSLAFKPGIGKRYVSSVTHRFALRLRLGMHIVKEADSGDEPERNLNRSKKENLRKKS